MKIALLGFDVEGRASFDYYKTQRHQIEIRDQNQAAQIPAGVPNILGENYLDNLNDFDLLVRTAGLPPEKILAKNPDVDDKITTLINEFFKVSPTKNIIGVTGTKGKGTTCTLITKMLEAAGKQVFLGGNIGTPPLTFLSKLTPESWVVLELSSFQLSDIHYSPHIGVCLMVVPEHQDWHHSVENYTLAKAQMFAHQTAADIAIYWAGNDLTEKVVSGSLAQKLPFFKPPGACVKDGWITIDEQNICQTSELKLLGEHNWQNVCAALTAVWQITQDVEAIRSVLTSFSGLPHRLELVRQVDGVKYYNDSFAATPDAAIAALAAIKGSKVMVLGGFDRMLPLQHLAKAINEHSGELKGLLIIGASQERLAKELDDAGYTAYATLSAQNMPEVVQAARQLANPGYAVILSPGFASFDMFKNFEERGNQFKKAVNDL